MKIRTQGEDSDAGSQLLSHNAFCIAHGEKIIGKTAICPKKFCGNVTLGIKRKETIHRTVEFQARQASQQFIRVQVFRRCVEFNASVSLIPFTVVQQTCHKNTLTDTLICVMYKRIVHYLFIYLSNHPSIHCSTQCTVATLVLCGVFADVLTSWIAGPACPSIYYYLLYGLYTR